MGLKQTNLSKKEEKVFDAVKGFLSNQGILPSDTPYVMIKYCIGNVCKQAFEVLEKNSLGLGYIGLEEADLEDIFKLRSRKKKKD